MERTFAGFWVDGAVRKPEPKHYDVHGEVVSKRKSDGDLGVWRSWGPQLNIADFYWLDTTTPTELTPQQAFEISKIIYPDLHEIEKAERGGLFVNEESTGIVNWDSLTEYPPRERWRVPTDADKGKRCRMRDSTSDNWIDCRITDFVCCWRDGFAVGYDDGLVQSWKYCEVLE